jgi:hypothetical protein
MLMFFTNITNTKNTASSSEVILSLKVINISTQTGEAFLL